MEAQTELSRVRALPETVIDQIAAGEVVERPSHLVKELLENSLDAGASSLTVDVSQGGRSVRVQDNGHGIHRDDLALILKRHTTSKIKAAEDLWQLSSFGFRGEALSSIAAVSHLRVMSRRRDAPEAFQIEAQFGKELPFDSVSHAVGTTVEVNQLFENLPARLKFLKSSQAETSAIRQIIKAMALVNSAVEIRFRVEGELDFYVPAHASFFERVRAVLEEDRLCLAQTRREGLELEIVFSDPHVVQKTSRALWFFVQGRAVQDRSLQAAVMEAYRGTLMHGEFPMVALSLRVPPDEVDVNIHPSKSQVKFLKPPQIFSFVHGTLRSALEDHLKPRQEVHTSQVNEPARNFHFESAELSRVQYQTKDLHSPLSMSDLKAAAQGREQNPDRPHSLRPEDVAASSGRTALPNFAKPPAGVVGSESPESPVASGQWSRLQVLAQAHLTYLVCQSEQGLCLIDQHAAHERVLFETLMHAWKSGEMQAQPLLFPLAMDLASDHIEALELVKEPFAKLGLQWESLGPQTLGIVQTPAYIKETALPLMLKKVSDDILQKGGSFEFEKSIHEILSTMACHSAIRAGQAMSIPEMQSLLTQMDRFPFSQFCPHGRPVSVRWSIDELEREFGRRA